MTFDDYISPVPLHACKIEVEEDKVMMTRQGDFITFNNKFPRLKSRKPSERIDELVKLVNQVRG